MFQACSLWIQKKRNWRKWWRFIVNLARLASTYLPLTVLPMLLSNLGVCPRQISCSKTAKRPLGSLEPRLWRWRPVSATKHHQEVVHYAIDATSYVFAWKAEVVNMTQDTDTTHTRSSPFLVLLHQPMLKKNPQLVEDICQARRPCPAYTKCKQTTDIFQKC